MTAPRHLAMLLSLLLTWTPSASAHIDVLPTSAAPGVTESFRLVVPNERQAAATVAIAVRLPPGFTDVRPDAGAPWKARVTADGDRTVIEWRGGEIRGTDTVTFSFTATTPKMPNATLPLPTTQTYSNGEVDRWIEDAAGDFSAPVLTLGSAGDTQPDDSGGGRGPWLIVATIAALVAVGALLIGRRPRDSDS